MRPLLLAAALLLTASPALAGYPQDVSLSQLDSYQGESYTNTSQIAADYQTVVQDLGVGIANKPQGSSTLGVDGYDVSMGSTLVFVTGNRFKGGPTAWERVREGNQATGALWVPDVSLRKGLPLSLEVGAHLGWMSFTRQGVVGGYGRVAPLEGQPKLPELAFQVGYTGYVGNDELELGVTDASVIVGKTVPFASQQSSKTHTIQPFGAVGMDWIKATPVLSPDRLAELGIGPLSAKKKDAASYEPGMRQVYLHAGVRIVSGDVAFRLGATVPTKAAPTLDTSIGYTF